MKYRFLESSRKYIRTFEVSGSQGCVTEDSSTLWCFALSNSTKFPKFLKLGVVLVSSVSKHPMRISSLLITEATQSLPRQPLLMSNRQGDTAENLRRYGRKLQAIWQKTWGDTAENLTRYGRKLEAIRQKTWGDTAENLRRYGRKLEYHSLFFS